MRERLREATGLTAVVPALDPTLRDPLWSLRSAAVPLLYGMPGDSKPVTFVEDKAVSIDLPASVVLTVTDAPEGIRGDSANNVQKPILLETGISIQAPLFIKTGEKVKIDTRTGKYMERA